MRNLEEQENLEDQENIETTYRKSPCKVLRGGESPMSEEMIKDTEDARENMEPPKEFSTKTLLGNNYQAAQLTPAQE